MLEIRHRNRLVIGNFESAEGEEAKNIGNKHGESVLDLNLELIQEDLERLEKKVKELRDRGARRYKEAINKYTKGIVFLESLKEKAVGGTLEVMWFIENDEIKTYPEFRDIPELGIHCTDYINLSRKLYEVNFKDLAELISLELMYQDIGYTKADIERFLEDEPMVWIKPPVLLSKLDEKVFEMSRILKIGDSPCLSHSGVMLDYFGVRDHKSGYYREPVKFSVEYAMLLILEDILEQTARIKFKIYGISDYKLYLAPDDADAERLLEIIKEPVHVMVFGRKFLVEPDIKVY